ncbi:MAG TPA: LacI family DNA-binding transcriptional regulator [Rhodothermales bacterium]|nr:LacI family DNA-binding transcriptional regulator [Rhodothermales bacterium]HRR09201.1 LacI family DNA-binding transcriptional regulator [Rhodothermales bacterium]
MSFKKKITIFDVASKAGVAISTVSRVVNGSALVKEETRLKVQKAIDELQFIPDRTAKLLAQKNKIPVITVAVPSFTTRFYNALLKGVKRALDQEQLVDILIFDMGFQDPDQRLIDFLDRGSVDALLYASSAMSEQLEERLLQSRTPVVTVGVQSEHFDCFWWDNRAGVRAALQHLIAMQHKKIGMIAAASWNVNAQTRTEVYKESIERAGLSFDPSYIQTGETLENAGYSEEAGYEAMKQLRQIHPDVTAVFCASDVQALGAWKAINEAGLRIPEDIALVGYDNISMTDFMGLSSVDQAMGIVGEQAMRLLLDRMSGGNGDRIQECITPNLVVRRSSNYQRIEE